MFSHIENEKDRKKVKNYINSEGKVAFWPAKRKFQLMLIDYVNNQIPSDKTFSEKEINSLLKEYLAIDDYVLIRRELIELGYLTRKADGSCYSKVSA